ncbi:MFS transporter [Bacteroidia bacterium]|nr:MFS transporter [Bacteroidia bacterium]
MFKNHPKGLVLAALSNMGERFGYYIMNAVLLLFLCSKFGLDEETGGIIYSCFYAGIYVLSLVGGLIADRLQNYKGTIMTGLLVMASGYIILAIPILSTATNITWLLPLTCLALLFIALGNGLFKGNLQVIIGQMYDNPQYSHKRDSGFQIFYVFINIGGLIAPFVAPLLRGWWLGKHHLLYNADLPALCHQYIEQGANFGAEKLSNLSELIVKTGGTVSSDVSAFCTQYLDVFNTGVHYSFIASVAAMSVSLAIFFFGKKILPNPIKKESKVENYTAEEKKKMAGEIKQRIYALLAVLGIAVFFWLSFHQNGTSLSLFARDFVVTSTVPPEIWQAINPFFVIVLTPLIMFIFGSLSKRGKEISTPKKIAFGMGIAGIAFLFLSIISYINGYPSATEFRDLADTAKEGLKLGPWVLVVLYFFLTVAELFISPLGLSFVSKVAPKNLQGLCQGLWLAATAVGNGLLWIGPWLYNKYSIWECWIVFVILCAISMVIMLSMVRWLERVTK